MGNYVSASWNRSADHLMGCPISEIDAIPVMHNQIAIDAVNSIVVQSPNNTCTVPGNNVARTGCCATDDILLRRAGEQNANIAIRHRFQPSNVGADFIALNLVGRGAAVHGDANRVAGDKVVVDRVARGTLEDDNAIFAVTGQRLRTLPLKLLPPSA